MYRKLGSCLLVAALTLLMAGAARADEYRTGRVSDLRGNLAVRGEHEDDVSYLERNAIIREGDTLWTDDDGRAEIELERGAWVRMAEDTKLEVHSLPPSGDFRLWTGSVYFDVSERIESPIRLKTPVGDVDVEPNSVVRVDLNESLSARVSVWNGRARVYPERGSSLRVGVGERIYMEADRPLEDPRRFDRGDLDGFDRFHRDRIDYYVNRPLPRELEREIVGARDLNDYGTWVVVDRVSYWRPRYEPGWRPYSHGYWSWVPGFGYSWVDYSPWGYATSHYGSWMYRPVYGWLWCPSYTWRPHYVHWGTYGGYYGWCPIDPWGVPAYYPGSGFSIGFGTGSFFFDYRSWTFCDRDRFFYGRHHWRHPDFDRRGRRQFFTAHDISVKNYGFNLVKDPIRDFGAPKSQVRGLTFGGNGRLARERVLEFENKLPATGLKRIENRFGVPATRDREFAQRGSDIPQLQRGTGVKIDDRIVRGDEAAKRVFGFRRPETGRPEVGRPGDGQPGGGGLKPSPVAPQPGGRDGSDDGNKPGFGRPRTGDDRPGQSPTDRPSGVKPGGSDRDGGFRRGLPGAGREGQPGGANPGGGLKPGNRPGEPGSGVARPGDGRTDPSPKPGFGTQPGTDRDRSGRDSAYRRGSGTTTDRGEAQKRFEPRTSPREDRGSGKPQPKSSGFGGGLGSQPDYRDFPLRGNPTTPQDRTGSSGRDDSPFRRGEGRAPGAPFTAPRSNLTPSPEQSPGFLGGERTRPPDPPKPGGSFRDPGLPSNRSLGPGTPSDRDGVFRRGSGSDSRSPFTGRPATGSSPSAPGYDPGSSGSRPSYGSPSQGSRGPSYDRSPSGYGRGGGYNPPSSTAPSNRGSFGGGNSSYPRGSYSTPGGSSYSRGSSSSPGGSSYSRGSFGSSSSRGGGSSSYSRGSFSSRGSYSGSRSFGGGSRSSGGRSFGSPSSRGGGSGSFRGGR